MNQFLQEMDGITSSSKVVVLAATNYPQKLDRGIIRRFDSAVFIDLPDFLARMSIVLNSLAAAYLPPDHDANQRKVMWDSVNNRWKPHGIEQTIMQSFSTYGHVRRIVPKVQPSGSGFLSRAWSFGKKTETDAETEMEEVVFFTMNDVVRLVRQTGPRVEAEEKMSSRRGRRDEFSNDALSKYGYSASDLVKVVDSAIALSAQRVIADREYATLYEKKFRAPVENISPRRVDVFDDADMRTDAPFYIFDAADMHANVRRYSMKQLEESDTSKYEENLARGADPNKFARYADRILNFALSREDVDAALKASPSSIDEDDYEALITWKNKRV